MTLKKQAIKQATSDKTSDKTSKPIGGLEFIYLCFLTFITVTFLATILWGIFNVPSRENRQAHEAKPVHGQELMIHQLIPHILFH